ncbi:hypothetical protein N0V83_002003 [Neocucurbitaria cava]|uniref:BTB domain-containing protein n=1 Tax=Neocucurbitaria cava TaxID=798079 RepID=A0A9W8YG70_9PLEO|nr:hypothetical protein N0V83_002003 [Neocucurbitaria cava]
MAAPSQDPMSAIFQVERDREYQPRRLVEPAPRQINKSWYQNPTLSDLTIVYGEHGEKQFQAHRFVLCNSSEWFMSASSNLSFVRMSQSMTRLSINTTVKQEAHDRIIPLKEDHPDALEALFEFCYTGDYTETMDGDNHLEWTKNLFMQHARVFIVADKYMVPDLRELALDRLEARFTCEVQNGSRVFLKFAIEELYLNDNLFAYENWPVHANENSVDREDSNEDNEEYTPEEHGGGSEVATRKDEADDHDDRMDTDSDEEGIQALLKDTAGGLHHPLDCLRDLVVGVTVNVLRHLPDDDPHMLCWYVTVWGKKMPEFAGHFAVVSMTGRFPATM